MMKLQTKITLSIIPLVVLSISFLGMWSLKKAEESIHQSTFLYMNTVMDAYLSDIGKLDQLLVKNGLDTIDSFVLEYQQNALATGGKIRIPDQSHIFIMDASGQLVFCSDKSDKKMMEVIWGPLAKKIAATLELESGYHLMDTGLEKLYVVRLFTPWGWQVFFAMEDQVVHAAERQIRNATIVIAGLCAILTVIIILMVFRKFFVSPIKAIGHAAASIATGEHMNQIDVQSKDELGYLARDMEKMSESIQKQKAHIQKSHDELEERVKERTIELEEALSEIKTLKGIIPICSYCKKIRDDQGYWNQIESYIHEHSDAVFSHSICQECAKKHYPDLDLYDD